MAETTATIAPAILPPEWSGGVVERDPAGWEEYFRIDFARPDGSVEIDGGGPDWDSVVVPQALRHAVAAACLAGKTFGFATEMVDALHEAAADASVMADRMARYAERAREGCAGEAALSARRHADTLTRTASVIAALLPPREVEVSDGR